MTIHDTFAPVFAAGWEELLTALLPLVLLVFWIIGQLSDAKNKNKAKQPPRQQPPGGPPQAREQAARGPDAIRNQVEEFLRHAGGQGEDAGQQGQPAARAAEARMAPIEGVSEIELVIDEDPPSRRPLSKPLQSIRESADARAAQAPRGRPGQPPLSPTTFDEHESVVEHVTQHISSGRVEMADHLSHLGERVVRADQEFDEKMHERFDHDLGELASRRAERMRQQESVVVRESAAAQIASMLANPEGVRQAVILNEILRRPE